MPRLFGKLSAAETNPFDFRIERLIALLRLVFTSYFLVFLISEPIRQPQFEPIQLILAVYAIFGSYIVLRLFFSGPHARWKLPVHLADIVIISTLVHLLEATSTTFLSLCVFVLLSATVQWNWRGALWTTSLMVALQALFSLSSGGNIDSLVQFTFLMTIGGMFAFFGASRERSYNRLMNLAAWLPPKSHTDQAFDNNWLDTSLMHAAAVLEAPRVLLLWEVAEEPSLFTAVFADGECKQNNWAADIYGNLVAPELTNENFFSEALHSYYCTVSSGKSLYLNPIINSQLQRHFLMSSVCSVPFIGEICKGRLFVLDRPNWDEADLTLAKVVASQLRIQLEHHILCVQLEENTANRERTKLARDLHDGILQSLTAAGLQLKTVSSRSDGKVQQDVENVRRLLITEQKRIRGFVEGRMLLNSQESFELSADMEPELDAIQRQWGCDVVLSVNPKDATVSQHIGHQIEFILAEASANAVRHGQASRIDVAIETIGDRIRLRISDNGHGLEAKPRAYSQNDLSELNIGPQSLRKRIEDLNGSLSLLSSPQGVELHVELPFCGSKAS